MPDSFEELLERARRARRDELRRLFLVVVVAMVRGVHRLPAAGRAARDVWVPAVWRLGPEDRPGC